MPEIAVAPRARWTFFVYLAADDKKLAPYAERSLRQMREVGSIDGVLNVLVQIDRRMVADGHDQRMRIGRLLDDEERAFRELNTGDPKQLLRFLRWGRKHFPADNYALVLWGHGLGVGYKDRKRRRWLRDPLRRFPRLRGKGGLPDESGDWMTAGKLRQVLDAFDTPLALLGFDACYMGAVEIAFHLDRCAGTFVASQYEIVDQSWPYHRILAEIKNDPGISGSALGRKIVRHYVESVVGSPHPKVRKANVTLTAVDLARVKALGPPICALVDAVESRLGKAGLARTAIRKAAYLGERQFIDLLGVCDRLGRDRDMGTAARRAGAALRAAILEHRTSGKAAAALQGLSVYFRGLRGGPWGVSVANYRFLAFARATGWERLMKAYARGRRRQWR